MQLIVADDYAGVSRLAADVVAETLVATPDAAIVVATGETPMGLYHELAARRERGDLDTSRLRAFQLDEYLGLPDDDRRSLYGWMRRSFLDPLGIPPERTVRLPGNTPEPEAACRAYDEAVASRGGIDLAILGLGPNGHLGFNEPPVAPDAPTRMVALTEESVESNARYWGGRDEVPRRALTAGMSVLLAARRILLVVSGAHKRGILRQACRGPVGPQVPASYLQQVSHVTVVADRTASGE